MDYYFFIYFFFIVVKRVAIITIVARAHDTTNALRKSLISIPTSCLTRPLLIERQCFIPKYCWSNADTYEISFHTALHKGTRRTTDETKKKKTYAVLYSHVGMSFVERGKTIIKNAKTRQGNDPRAIKRTCAYAECISWPRRAHTDAGGQISF